MRTALCLAVLLAFLPACAAGGTRTLPPELSNTLLLGLAIDDYRTSGDEAALIDVISSTLGLQGVYAHKLSELVEVYADYRHTGDKTGAQAQALAVLGLHGIAEAEGIEPDPLILAVVRRFLRDDPALDAELVARMVTAGLGLTGSAASSPAAPVSGTG